MKTRQRKKKNRFCQIRHSSDYLIDFFRFELKGFLSYRFKIAFIEFVALFMLN